MAVDPAPKYLTGNKQGIREFVDRFDTFLFDCDGVLWSGDHLFEGTVETLEMLRGKGKRIVFVTNNSTKSRADYQKKLSSMGIPATIEEIFGSAYSSAIYISRILHLPPPRQKVFILGESGIETELDSESIPHICGTDPSFRREMTPQDFISLSLPSDNPSTTLDPAVGIVLAGLDFHTNYLKLATAYQYLTRPAEFGGPALFLATNTDSTLPSSKSLFPGAGAVTAPLVRMLGGMEPLALGKPSAAMMDAIQGKFELDRARTCMVGDRLDTDIRFGIEGGLGGTLAVLTGVSTREEWEGEGAVVRPGYWVDRLGDLRGGA